MDLISQFGLSQTILNVGPFYPKLILEFIVNFSSSSDYQTIHVYKCQIVISPTVINAFLGLVTPPNPSMSSPSTDELACVLASGTFTVWPMNDIPVASFSVKYAFYTRLGLITSFPHSMALVYLSHLLPSCIGLVLVPLWMLVCSFILNSYVMLVHVM